MNESIRVGRGTRQAGRAGLLFALLGALALGGCDSPGSGGGAGGVPCSANPNQPFCQTDAGVTAQDAAGTSDASWATDTPWSQDASWTQDAGGTPDTSQPDTSGVVDAWWPQDAGPTPDTSQPDVPVCSPAQRRCGGDGVTVEECVEGAWVTIETCAPPSSCAGSACVPAPAAACTGAEDLALLMDGSFVADYGCIIPCLTTPEPTCASSCLQDNYGFSAACADCTSGLVACGASACGTPCANDPYSAPCVSCLDASCSASFVDCAGVPFDVIGSQPR